MAHTDSFATGTETSLCIPKTLLIQQQEINIIKLPAEIKGAKITELIKKEFIPFTNYTDKEQAINFFAEIVDQLLPNKEIYSPQKTSKARSMRLPSILSYYEYPNGTICYLTYRNQAFRKDIFFAKSIPSYIKQGTLIVTGKKRISTT
jgi:hypothetical protein